MIFRIMTPTSVYRKRLWFCLILQKEFQERWMEMIILHQSLIVVVEFSKFCLPLTSIN
jgi:hypothetical protein